MNRLPKKKKKKACGKVSEGGGGQWSVRNPLNPERTIIRKAVDLLCLVFSLPAGCFFPAEIPGMVCFQRAVAMKFIPLFITAANTNPKSPPGTVKSRSHDHRL